MFKLHSAAYDIGYPVHDAKFLNDSTLLVTGGNSQESLNRLTALAINFSKKKKPIKRFRELKLKDEDDTPSVLDTENGVILVGCNESAEAIRAGHNHSLQKYVYHNEHLKYITSTSLEPIAIPLQYQKLIRISRDGTMAATATTRTPTVIHVLDVVKVYEKYEIETNNSVQDLDISQDGKLLAYITENTLEIISTVTGKSITRKTDFKSGLAKIKFQDNDNVILAQVDEDTKNNKQGITVSRLNIKNNVKVLKKAIVSKKFKSITSLDVNTLNGCIALSTGIDSNNSLILIKAQSLKVMKTFQDAHHSQISKINFSPNGGFLSTVSLDKSIHVYEIPPKLGIETHKIYNFFRNLFILIIVIALSYLGWLLYQSRESQNLELSDYFTLVQRTHTTTDDSITSSPTSSTTPQLTTSTTIEEVETNMSDNVYADIEERDLGDVDEEDNKTTTTGSTSSSSEVAIQTPSERAESAIESSLTLTEDNQPTTTDISLTKESETTSQDHTLLKIKGQDVLETEDIEDLKTAPIAEVISPESTLSLKVSSSSATSDEETIDSFDTQVSTTSSNPPQSTLGATDVTESFISFTSKSSELSTSSTTGALSKSSSESSNTTVPTEESESDDVEYLEDIPEAEQQFEDAHPKKFFSLSSSTRTTSGSTDDDAVTSSSTLKSSISPSLSSANEIESTIITSSSAPVTVSETSSSTTTEETGTITSSSISLSSGKLDDETTHSSSSQSSSSNLLSSSSASLSSLLLSSTPSSTSATLSPTADSHTGSILSSDASLSSAASSASIAKNQQDADDECGDLLDNMTNVLEDDKVDVLDHIENFAIEIGASDETLAKIREALRDLKKSSALETPSASQSTGALESIVESSTSLVKGTIHPDVPMSSTKISSSGDLPSSISTPSTALATKSAVEALQSDLYEASPIPVLEEIDVESTPNSEIEEGSSAVESNEENPSFISLISEESRAATTSSGYPKRTIGSKNVSTSKTFSELTETTTIAEDTETLESEVMITATITASGTKDPFETKDSLTSLATGSVEEDEMLSGGQSVEEPDYSDERENEVENATENDTDGVESADFEDIEEKLDPLEDLPFHDEL